MERPRCRQVNLHNAWLQISSCILASTFVFGNTIKVREDRTPSHFLLPR